MFYVAFRLAQRGWVVKPAVGRTRGIDMVAHGPAGGPMVTLEVRSTSQPDVLPVHGNEHMIADYLIVCTDVFHTPRSYVLDAREAVGLFRNWGSVQDRPADLVRTYDRQPFREGWDRLDVPTSVPPLGELIDAIAPENLHEEIDLGPPVGRERW
jgi:hypothetical protein